MSRQIVRPGVGSGENPPAVRPPRAARLRDRLTAALVTFAVTSILGDLVLLPAIGSAAYSWVPDVQLAVCVALAVAALVLAVAAQVGRS